MKKLFFILFICPLASYGQQAQAQAQAQSTQVTVESTTVNEVDPNVGYAAIGAAAAAKVAAMSEPLTEVITPLTVDLYDYTHIALVNVSIEGYQRYGSVSKSLSISPLTVINPKKYDKKKYKKKKTYLRTIKNPKWLYVNYIRSTQGFDDIRNLTIRDSENKVLYKTNNRNISFDEVVSVLTDM